MKRTSHWIDGGEWTRQSQRRGEVYDPATGRVAGQVDFASPAEVDAAVAAAARAYPGGATRRCRGAPGCCSRSGS